MKVIVVANTSWLLQNFQTPFIRDLQSRNLDVVAVAPQDEWSSRFASLGVRYIPIVMNRKGLNPFADVRLMVQLYRLYKKEQAGFIFHNTIKPVIYGSLAAKLAGQKNVTNMIPGLGYIFIGGGIFHRALRSVVKNLYRFALRGYDMVFFQNLEDRNYFVSNRIVAENNTAVTFGYGVDLERFQQVETREQNGQCTFLLMARMLWDKGVGDFVEASKIIKETAPSARFLLLGRVDKDNPSGIDKEKLEEWNSSGYVEYLGEVADVRNVVASADVVVLPSFYREGLPSSLMEALAMNKPIITTDMPGCRETVVQGVNGMLVQPRDIESLVKAMKFMIENPQQRVEMGKESRKLAVQRFDVKRVNKMIADAMNLPSPLSPTIIPGN